MLSDKFLDFGGRSVLELVAADKVVSDLVHLGVGRLADNLRDSNAVSRVRAVGGRAIRVNLGHGRGRGE